MVEDLTLLLYYLFVISIIIFQKAAKQNSELSVVIELKQFEFSKFLFLSHIIWGVANSIEIYIHKLKAYS